jgi:predicted Zn-dependent peptidase
MVYEKHPYRWPTIGKELKHIEDATLEDVKDFYKKHYQPGNAILVVAGNVALQSAKELVKKYFGAIHGTPTSIINFFEPKQTEAKEKTVQADVPLNAVFIAFKMCSRLHPDYYVADVTSDILSNGPSSRLHQRLVKEAKAFVEIDAYITASDDIGMFVIEGKVAENTDVQAAINLIWKELLLIQQELVNEQELQKCKNKMLTYQNFAEASLLNRAIGLATYEELGNANLINEEEKNYDAVTAERILQFAQQTFGKEKSSTLYYLKK